MLLTPVDQFRMTETAEEEQTDMEKRGDCEDEGLL